MRLVDAARSRSVLLDHVVAAVLHYRARQGSTLAAAVTYYAFLSLFPVLALSFAAVGMISAYAPGARRRWSRASRPCSPG